MYCCWEPKLVVASVKIYLAWALVLYTPALVIADYVVELDLFPGNPFLSGVLGTQFILGLFIGGFMMVSKIKQLSSELTISLRTLRAHSSVHP